MQEAHVLTVPDVNHEDSGTYVCTASNKQGKVQAFTKLNVHGESLSQSSYSRTVILSLIMTAQPRSYQIIITSNIQSVHSSSQLCSQYEVLAGERATVHSDFNFLGPPAFDDLL